MPKIATSNKGKLSKAKRSYLKGPSAGKKQKSLVTPTAATRNENQSQEKNKQQRNASKAIVEDAMPEQSVGPVKEKKQRKNKTYLDQNSMLHLVGLINESKETVIERKLEKEAHIAEKIKERDAKLEERKQKKKGKLNAIKRDLKEKQSRKGRRTRSQMDDKDTPDASPENKPASQVKRVRFG
ncbi:hypothetical protein BDF19DRAFT_451872 [Syncephalis fuscata]|nr:hypothetical protein BDF19DRAFT_451872 [Syncephalis fuscata]